MPKDGYLTYRLPQGEYERLSALAARRGVSLSEMARRCLRVGVREYERRTPVAPAPPEPAEEPAA